MFGAELDTAYETGPKHLRDAFPPACLRSHWDPTMVSKHILPAGHTAQTLPQDPRQAVRICTSYYQLARPSESADALNLRMYAPQNLRAPEALLGGPRPPGLQAARDYLPFGGAAGAGTPLAGNPDIESTLQGQTELLTRCKERRYMPRVPATSASPEDGGSMFQGLAAPTGISYSAIVRGPETPTGCRSADDAAAWRASPRAFYNHTRRDRMNGVHNGSGVVLPYPAWATAA